MSDHVSSFWTIGLGTVTVAAASGIFTGVYSIVKNRPDAGLLTTAAILNSAATASVFFGCREFIVSPLLTHYASGEQYAHRRKELGISPVTNNETSSILQGTSWTDLRWNKLLDSGLSGMLTGGALRGFRRPSAIIPGAMLVGTTATILQYGYNELSILRLRYISNLQKRPKIEDHHTGSRSVTKALNEVSEPAVESLLKFFGVIPMSDEEYLAKLRRSREIYVRRIAELERQIEEEMLMSKPPK